MQFSDIDLAWKELDQHESTSVDVLSSTTTMEVGIDIGELSGVALRNMPPGRAKDLPRNAISRGLLSSPASVIVFACGEYRIYGRTEPVFLSEIGMFKFLLKVRGGALVMTRPARTGSQCFETLAFIR
jgi:ATP-dependent helicase YprA (DUF1998 family)